MHHATFGVRVGTPILGEQVFIGVSSGTVEQKCYNTDDWNLAYTCNYSFKSESTQAVGATSGTIQCN